MKVKVMVNCDLDIEQLAEALAVCSPKEFNEFWYHFADLVKGPDLVKIASEMTVRYMGHDHGNPLLKLADMVRAKELGKID